MKGSPTSHKDYLKNMLINKFSKKYPGDYLSRRMIEIEVQVFIANEFVTKENMKALEVKIARKINPPQGKMERANKKVDDLNMRSPSPEGYNIGNLHTKANSPTTGKK